MSSPVNLRLDWCSRARAQYAVEHWHYSHKMPAGRLATIGVEENGRFIGAVLLGRGATPQIYKHWNLKQTQLCELVRVALRAHVTPTTRIVAIAMKLLAKENPAMELVISFADKTNQDHDGVIYQAGNWYYLGESRTSSNLLVNGRFKHGRARKCDIRAKYGADAVQYAGEMLKYRYAYPLHAKWRSILESKRQSFPRAGSLVGEAPAIQAEEGGSIPTPALS